MNGVRFKSYLGWLFGCFILAVLGIAAANWIVDPLQFYRKAAYPPLLSGQKRFQAPGLARNYDYDAVVIGTSMSINITATQVREKLGFNALNLSMQGPSAREQHLLLQIALRTGKVKRVIWEVNYEYLRGDPEWVSSYDGTFPCYFYDRNAFNEVNNYLLNVDTTKSTLKVLLARYGLKSYPDRDPEALLTQRATNEFGRAGVQRAWHRAVKGRPALRARAPEFAVTNLNRNFDLNVMTLIREHPEVRFYLYFPPYSAAYYANVMAVAPEIFTHMIENREYIFHQTTGLKNVQLHDFQGVTSLIFNVDNYCDLIHFNPRVNDYILESIRDARQVLTVSGLSQFESLVSLQCVSSWVEQHV